jgi:hypothetical protein
LQILNFFGKTSPAEQILCSSSGVLLQEQQLAAAQWL